MLHICRWLSALKFESKSMCNGLFGFLSSRPFHSQLSLFTLDRNIRRKNGIIKTATNAKFEFCEKDSLTDPSGLTEAGITIPTLETHASLIDGVRYDELPVVHIKSSLNNTIMTITDHKGTEFIGRSSCGQEGFKNVKKSTNVAAQATGLSLGMKMVKKGVVSVRVAVKGLGAGRLASIKGLQMAGMKIVSITDRTHVQHIGPRPRKAKRL